MFRQSIFIVIILLLGCMISLAQTKESETTKGVPIEKFDPKRDAEKDIKQAIAEASKSGKRILLDVGGEWCIWCRKLDKFFQDNKDVGDFLHKYYITVKVNYSKENDNKALLSKYPKIEGYPHIFVLEKNGKLLHSQDTGKLESGDHHDHDKVFDFLKKWAPAKLN